MSQVLIENRKAYADYEIMEKYEAGIVLSGIEVKSLRSGKASLRGSFVSIRGGEIFLLGASISPYQENNTPKSFDSLKARKLILSKKEIAKIADLEAIKGLTIVPLSVYNKSTKIKVEIAVVRGKKKYDKRNDIKRRELDRSLHREFLRNNE